MGFRLKIEGATTIELQEQNITAVTFRADIPEDSNARSTDLGSTIEIIGKVLTAVDGEAFDATKEIGKEDTELFDIIRILRDFTND